MITLILSLLLVAYVLVPGVLFRSAFSLFIPLRKFQRTRTDEVTFAVLSSLLPFVLAFCLIWTVEWIGKHPFYFPDNVSQRRADYKLIFAASYSEQVFRENEQAIWKATTRSLRRQGRMLTWYYLFLVLEAIIFGALSKSFGRFHRNKLYGWLAAKVLLPSISEWHVLLTPFSFPHEPNRKVMVDALTSDDHLYRGEVGDYFLDSDGKLSGIFLVDTRRFDRHTYLKEKDSGCAQAPDSYWKPIPGSKLYLFADKITNLNISYEPEAPITDFVNQILQKLKISAQVKVIPRKNPARD